MGRFLAVVLVSLGILVPAARAFATPPDPLMAEVNRTREYLKREEVDGITWDARYALNPSEIIRLSIVSQLLGYNELYAVTPGGALLGEVRTRADFLLAHVEEIRSGSPFDGMLAYALLGAYEITGDERCFAAGERIVLDLYRFSGWQNTLNWGLMAAMGTAKYYDLTGDPTAYAKTQEIVSSLATWQHEDGSFPHYCPLSTDVHYTAWMGMELVHVRRYVPSPRLDRTLDGITGFLEARILPRGGTEYEAACPGAPGGRRFYYSEASGCWFDYDTRAWVNELGYTGIVLADRGRPLYSNVMSFLYGLDDHGAFDDKWAFVPPPGDPYFPWSTGHPSVIRTSVVFWSLATMVRERSASRTGEFHRPVHPAAGSLAEGAKQWVPDQAAGPDRLPKPWRRFVWSTADSLVLEGADPDVICGSAAGQEVSVLTAGGGQAELATATPAAEAVPAGAPEPSAVRSGRSGPESAAAGAKAVPSGTLEASPQGSAVRLRFSLPRAGALSLAVFDVSGRRIRDLYSGWLPAGTHVLTWDGRGAGGEVSPGIYFARLHCQAAPEWGATARIPLCR